MNAKQMREKRLEKEKEEKGEMTGKVERVKCNDKKNIMNGFSRYLAGPLQLKLAQRGTESYG